MGRYIKRPEIVAFLNTTPSGTTKTWSLIGNGMTTGAYSYSAQETTETYIVDENATTLVDSYQVSIDGEMKCLFGDEVYDYINGLRFNLATGSSAETQVLLIDKYDEVDNSYKAQQFNCSVSISTYGGDGGATPVIGFKLNINGTPTNGTATISGGTPTFTPETSL